MQRTITIFQESLHKQKAVRVVDPGSQILANDRGHGRHGKTFDLALSKGSVFLAVLVFDPLIQELDLLRVHEIGGAGPHGKRQNPHSVVVATQLYAVVHQRLQNNLKFQTYISISILFK